ncbi:MAG: tetratricopeptide repeat protein [Zoogloeaceae bacterium]|jgi:thioredoxin-like negative regulator of GroEL|nr:tetratricopeptide repeat protein [Zoogloeaceae bacterium]
MTDLIDNTQLARLVDVGLAAAHLGKPGAARAIFENLIAYKPGHAPARIGLAFTYLVCNDFEKAAALLRDEVLAQNPEDGEALALLGLAQSFAGNPEAAAQTLARVPAGSPASRLVQALAAFKA